jgi:hypothetical protein
MFRPWKPLIVPPQLSGRVLDRMLPMLVGLNLDYLQEHPRVPMMYESGVRYRPEDAGEEVWLTIPWILLCLAADCEDLACWRVAELQLRGVEARAVWSSRMTPQGELYHIRVMHPDGRIEDPSALLGMGWEQQYAKKYGPTHGVTDPREPWKPTGRISQAEMHNAIAWLRDGRTPQMLGQ